MLYLHTTYPHKVKGVWTYDCPTCKDIKKFPFVDGDVLDIVSQNIKNAEYGFVLHVSSEPIVRAQYTLSPRMRTTEGPTLYRLVRTRDNLVYADLFPLNPETHVKLYLFVEESHSTYTLWINRLSKWLHLDGILNA
jgi:hypothetical protein